MSIYCRLLTENTESLVVEMDQFLEKVEAIEDNAAFNLVNALEDLLWAFNLRATASWVFQLAIKRNIYNHNVFRYLLCTVCGGTLVLGSFRNHFQSFTYLKDRREFPMSTNVVRREYKTTGIITNYALGRRRDQIVGTTK